MSSLAFARLDVPSRWLRGPGLVAALRSGAWRDLVAADSVHAPSRTLDPRIEQGAPDASALLLRGWEIIGVTGTLAVLRRYKIE